MFYWLKLAFKNMSRKVKRTLIVGCILFFGSLIIALAIAWGNGMTSQMRQNMVLGSLGHIQVYSEKYMQEEAGDMTNSLDRPDLNKNLLINDPDKVMDILRSFKNTDNVCRRLATKGVVSSSFSTQGLMIFGIEPKNESVMLDTIKSGSKDINKGEIIVNKSVADGLKVKKGEKIKVSFSDASGKIRVVDLTIKDYFTNSAPWYSLMAYVNLDYFQEILGLEKNHVSEIIITLKNDSKVVDYKASLQNDFKKLDIKNKVLDWKESGKSLNQVADGVGLMLNMTYVLIFIIVALGIASIMLIIVNERLKEMGTLAAIGMTSGQVVRLFVLEILMLSVISALVGVIAAGAIANYLSKVGIQAGNQKSVGLIFGGDRLYMKWSNNIILISFVWTVLVSIISTVFSALKVAFKKPVDALRGNL